MRKNQFNSAASLLSYALFLAVIFLFLPLLQAHGQSSGASFKVEVVGKGPAMILIPGLSCSGEVWKETVARYQDSYQCHVLTLAGFAGQSPIHSKHFLETVSQELSAYIHQQKLHKPIVVGHSLGGTIALLLGAREPELPGALFIVDSAPFLPALFNPSVTVEGAQAMAEEIRKSVQSQTKEQLRQTQPQLLSTMISGEARIA